MFFLYRDKNVILISYLIILFITLMFCFISLATLIKCNFDIIMIEPKMDYSVGDDDATDIATNKWFMLKSIKNVKSSVCKSCWLKTHAGKELNEVDGLDLFVEIHKKLKEIMSEYTTRFTDPSISKNDIEVVKSAFIKCLKFFITDDTFFLLFTSGKQSIEKYLNEVTVHEYYNSSYDICLTQYISHTMQRNFENNDKLMRIWFRIVRQMFLDSMYLACSREALCKEDEMANEDFRQNSELGCVQSEIFYDDLMGFFKNVLGNKNKLRISKKIVYVIIDVSQYLIHFLMRNLEKINNDPDFFEYENSFVTELMAYLQFNPDYQKTIKQIYLPKDMTLSWASMPNKRCEVREILSLLDIDTDKYEKCLKTAASLSLICARYKTCVNNIFKNEVFIKYAKENSRCVPVNTNRGDKTDKKCKNISIIPYQIEVSENLTVRLIYTGSNVFDELDAKIDKEIISCVYFTCSKPLKQKIDKLNNLCGFTKTEKKKQVSKPVIKSKRKINKKVKTQSTRIEHASDSQEKLSSVDEQLDDLVALMQSKSKILCDTQSKAKKGIQKQKTDITSTSKDTHERFEVKENTHKSKNMTLAAKTQPKNLLRKNRSNKPKNSIKQLSPKQKDKQCSNNKPIFNCKNAAYSKVHGDNVESIGDQNQYTSIPHVKDTVKPIEEEIKQALSRRVLANEPLLQLQSDFDLQDAIVDHQIQKSG